MTNRVSKTDLQQTVNVLANRLGRPERGQGALVLNGAYGGWRLHEVVENTGERDLSPRLPKSELARFIRAMLIGIDLAEQNVGEYYSLPSWPGPK